MKGVKKYSKYLAKWNDYVMNQLLNKFYAKFPDTINEPPTIRKIERFLVDQDWIEQIQRYTWRSAKVGGYKGTFKEFQLYLLKYDLDGQTVDVWGNSRVPKMARKLSKSIKKKNKLLKDRLAKVGSINAKNFADNTKYVEDIFNTIKKPKGIFKGREYKKQKKALRMLLRDYDNMSDAMRAKKLRPILKFIKQDIQIVQQQAIVNTAFDKVLGFQGRRLAQDQLQRENALSTNDRIDTLSDKAKANQVVVGYWSLSPSHKKHYWKGGTDPCELNARHDDGYGRGSFVGDIPIPVSDTHVGCRCNMVIKLEKKKKK